MNQNQQVSNYIQQLKQQHPQAFKRNFLLYGQIKTKGILDERKEFIPLILALMIFLPISYFLSLIVEQHITSLEGFATGGSAVLMIMLTLMLISPVVLKQIKHSSISTYEQLKNTPFKLTILILLQAINIGFWESWFIQGVLFYFAINFGFVKFYKENLFRENTSKEHFHFIQEIRRVAFWCYKQNLKMYFKLMLTSKNSVTYHQILNQKKENLELYVELINYENKLCLKYKHTDIEKYLDSIM